MVSEETLAEVRYWSKELARREREENPPDVRIPGVVWKQLKDTLKDLQEIINQLEEGN